MKIHDMEVGQLFCYTDGELYVKNSEDEFTCLGENISGKVFWNKGHKFPLNNGKNNGDRYIKCSVVGGKIIKLRIFSNVINGDRFLHSGREYKKIANLELDGSNYNAVDISTLKLVVFNDNTDVQ